MVTRVHIPEAPGKYCTEADVETLITVFLPDTGLGSLRYSLMSSNGPATFVLKALAAHYEVLAMHMKGIQRSTCLFRNLTGTNKRMGNRGVQNQDIDRINLVQDLPDSHVVADRS